MSDFAVSVTQINNLFQLVYQLKETPIWISTFNTGIKVNFGVEQPNCCFQLVTCLDDTIDLQLNNNGFVSIIENGNFDEIQQTLNTILKYEKSKL
jgi:hypothetical protein